MTSVEELKKERAELDAKIQHQGLDDYQKYVSALKNTTATGFLEFKPSDETAQAKYSAMSPSWEGIESSDAAIARGEYDLDRAETSRLREAKKPQPQYVPPKPQPKSSSSCVIQ
jgi:hypothetical protein